MRTNNHFPHERGFYASLTPKHDIPELMHQQWNDGNIHAVKQHFVDARPKERRGDRGCALGAYNDDEAAYYDMWERISGWTMNDEGYLYRCTTDEAGVRHADTIPLALDRVMRGLNVASIHNYAVLDDNMKAAMEICGDDETFLCHYSPFIFNNEAPQLYFQNWLKEHRLDKFDMRHLCATFRYWGAMNRSIETVFMRTSVLRHYMPDTTINILRSLYDRQQAWKRR